MAILFHSPLTAPAGTASEYADAAWAHDVAGSRFPHGTGAIHTQARVDAGETTALGARCIR